MCGIVGWVSSKTTGTPEPLHRATEALKHRGPDDEGFLFADSGRVALGHRRLSIIDLSSAGRQPMELREAGLTIVFNGEIYNYLELRAELESHGARFRTRSDTETLLHAWAHWGPACLGRLVGMFAFALYDAPGRRVYLARDCFGIKPLFYARRNGCIAFASEIPPLLDLADVPRKANPRRVFSFLEYGIADYSDETFFEEISQVPPAHCWEIPLDGREAGAPARYWHLPLDRVSDLSFEEAAKQLRELFLKSVSLHLRTDVALGVALSGGIDSSSVLMAAFHLLDRGLQIQTISYIADDPGITEERWVDEVNHAALACARKFRIAQGDLARDFDTFLSIQGEPVMGPVAYAQWRVFREARAAGIKVLLEGQGADEMLAGYPLYLPARIMSLMRSGRFVQALRLARAKGASRRRAMSTCLRAVSRRPRRGPTVFRWIREAWTQKLGIPEAVASPGGRHALRHSLHETLVRSKLPAFLRWGDRNSMAWSIENRVPFLTVPLAEFLYSLPEQYLLAGDGTGKAVFRSAMRGITPDVILDRDVKIGFATPYSEWLLGMQPQAAELLEISSAIPALDADALRADCAPFLKGGIPSLEVTQRLWGVLFLAGWTKRFRVAYDT